MFGILKMCIAQATANRLNNWFLGKQILFSFDDEFPTLSLILMLGVLVHAY